MNKNKSSDNQPAKGQTTTEGIEELYVKEPSFFHRPLVEHSGVLRTYYFLVCLVVGIFGGILGELFVNNYFSSQGLQLTSFWQPAADSTSDEKQQVIILRSSEANKAESTALSSLVEAAGASVVGIFPEKKVGESIWDSIYLPSEQLGNGLILTSDGWIVTSEQVITTTSSDLVVVFSDKNMAKVERVVIDKASGAVFIKADAQGLKVVKFGSSQIWFPGEQLLVLASSVASGKYKTALTNLARLNYQPAQKPQDLLQNSETYKEKVLLKDAVDREFFGSPVVNLKGEIIGILYGGQLSPSSSELSGNIVIPHNYFSQVLKNLLANGEIDRPYLGVNYLDLAQIVGLDKNVSEGRQSGAVLYGERGTLPAVMPDSPAAKAGLKAGDIIIKVNNEAVDTNNSLTELVQQYKVGDVLKLTIIFQGTERVVDAVLTAKPKIGN